jgi:hypothetical protein
MEHGSLIATPAQVERDESAPGWANGYNVEDLSASQPSRSRPATAGAPAERDPRAELPPERLRRERLRRALLVLRQGRHVDGTRAPRLLRRAQRTEKPSEMNRRWKREHENDLDREPRQRLCARPSDLPPRRSSRRFLALGSNASA